MSDVNRYTYDELRRTLPPEFKAAEPVWVHASDYDALAAELERVKRLWLQACRDMDSCACEWEPDPDEPGEHTDKIQSLCAAHEELFKQRADALLAALEAKHE